MLLDGSNRFYPMTELLRLCSAAGSTLLDHWLTDPNFWTSRLLLELKGGVCLCSVMWPRARRGDSGTAGRTRGSTLV